MKPKVCYILPLYEEGTDTHFFYNYELLRSVADRLDMFVIIEKYGTPSVAYLGTDKIYIQKFRNPLLRFLEILFVVKLARLRGYKNFYSHYSYYGAVASWFIARVFGGNVFYWNRGMPWLFKRSMFEEKMLRFVLRHTILVTSPVSLAEEYVQRYGVKKYNIFSNWIDIERYRPNSPKEVAKKQLGLDPQKKYVLFVHHLSERKGADFIAPVAKKLENNTVFLVAGDGDYMEKLKNQSISGIGNLKILGKISQRDVVKYFHAADVFFMPSREEGSPHVLLEAMASGTPFVASRVGGVDELVPHGQEHAFLCESGDVACFSKKISVLLNDEKKYIEAKNSILFWVHRFDKERGMREFVNLFV